METPLSIFLPFPRLPQELRLEIWRLALPARTIEHTWNNSEFQWEFGTKVPSVLQTASEARAAFFNTDSPTALKYGMKVEGEDLVDDIRPFYYSKLDTLYVRHEFHINDITVLSECLRSLKMDWGMPPYWWLGSQLQGPTLLRKFPHLEVFTLVIRTSKTTQEDQDIADVETAKEYTARAIEIERGRYPEWRMPRIRFDWKKDQIDWKCLFYGGDPPA